jgi:Fatty acid desaturase
VDEPVLRSALAKLSQDEARHTFFFSRLVIDALEQGNAKTLALLREALDQFKMPLADMMDNYRRKAVQMMRAANGYDYREAFEYFARLLRQVADRRTQARGTNLMDLVRFAEQLVPTH